MMIQGAFTNAVAVVKSDSTVLKATQALYVGTTGDVAVVMASRADVAALVAVTFVGVPAGTVLPISVQKVMSTNTTASNIVALR